MTAVVMFTAEVSPTLAAGLGMTACGDVYRGVYPALAAGSE